MENINLVIYKCLDEVNNCLYCLHQRDTTFFAYIFDLSSEEIVGKKTNRYASAENCVCVWGGGHHTTYKSSFDFTNYFAFLNGIKCLKLHIYSYLTMVIL